MKFYLRLLAYVRPYSLQALVSVLLMATVGLLDAFRILLIKPIFDQVLKPGDITPHLPLFHFVVRQRVVQLNLEQLVPGHFHNAWTMVAFALVAATVTTLYDFRYSTVKPTASRTTALSGK